MKKNEIIASIEFELSKLCERMTEKEYITFITNNELLSIYDIIIEKQYYKILTKKFLIAVYELVKSKNRILNH
ncbi:MAG: hypothetical protein HFH31_01780 [Bacilli bacterium]|nr:hypothetical protein [Bacilli bacterium]